MSRCLFLAVIFGLVAMPACVSSRVQGRALTSEEPAYGTIAVFCDVDQEEAREEIEGAVAAQLTEGQVRATPSLDILTESRVYEADEVRRVLADGGYEAMLVLGFDDYFTEVFTNPGSIGVAGSPYGGAVYFEPPTAYDRSTLRVTLQLLDRESDRPVWEGEAVASSSQIHSLEGLAKEIAAKARGVLEDDGMIVRRARANR